MQASRRKFHFLYKTTCKLTRRFYVGMHSSDSLNDDYLGSGRRLRASVKKHGFANHVREIIEMCESRTELKEREKHIVNEELLSNPLCLNECKGGEGGPIRLGRKSSEETKEKIRQSLLGHSTSEETKKRIGEKSLGRGKGKQLSPEHRSKISEAKKKYVFTEEHKRNISRAKLGILL